MDTIIGIKRDFIGRFGEDALYDYTEGNCLAHWVNSLGNPLYQRMLAELTVTEHDRMMLLHYGYPHDIDGVQYYEAFDGLLAECRSVVIDVDGECLVLTPFRKFMNINECPSTSMDAIRERLSRATVVEFSDKMDGSMQSARFHDGRLVMSGSRSLDRSKSLRLERGYSFIESHGNYMDMLRDNPDLTFVFEYIFDDDPHVVDYSGRDQGLYLIGIRDIRDGREYHYHEVLDMAERYGVMSTSMETMGLDEALEHLRTVQGNEKEGFVMNIDGFRVKLKSDDYVFLNKVSWKIYEEENILNAIKNGTFDDVISKLPPKTRAEVMPKAERVFAYMESRRSEVMRHLETIGNLGLSEKRDVMIWINDNIPPRMVPLVRNAYLGKDIDYLHNTSVEDVFDTRKQADQQSSLQS